MNLSAPTEQYTDRVKEAKPIGNLFDISDYTFRLSHTLFEPDLRIAVTQCRCPYCGNKLYLMRNGKMYYCKSVKHKNRFIISAEKVIK